MNEMMETGPSPQRLGQETEDSVRHSQDGARHRTAATATGLQAAAETAAKHG